MLADLAVFGIKNALNVKILRGFAPWPPPHTIIKLSNYTSPLTKYIFLITCYMMYKHIFALSYTTLYKHFNVQTAHLYHTHNYAVGHISACMSIVDQIIPIFNHFSIRMTDSIDALFDHLSCKCAKALNIQILVRFANTKHICL